MPPSSISPRKRVSAPSTTTTTTTTLPGGGGGNTTTFPTAGRELLLELKRCSNNNNSINNGSGIYLPPYNTKLTQACFQDLKNSVQVMQELIQVMSLDNDNDDNNDNDHNDLDSNKNGKHMYASRPAVLFHNASIERHKRCLLAYHKYRMDQLRYISTSSRSDFTFTNAAEADFAQQYQELRATYADAMDLESLACPLPTPPPTAHMIQVRVVQDVGQVVLDSGRTVILTKGSTLFVQRSDAMEFLQTGVLELVDGEEVDF